MAYSLVTATDFADMLGELELFVEAQGWTVNWNTGSQFGCNNGTCFAAFGTQGVNPVVVTDTYPDPDINLNDFRFFGALSSAFSAGNQFWGHTGSMVMAADDLDRIRINDMTGPFSEIHFFGDDNYIWIVVRSTADRWTTFGFGLLDKKGMTHPDVSFMAGTHWEWWENTAVGGTPVKAKLDYLPNINGGNRLWFDTMRGRNLQIFIPDGTLNPAYGIADGLCIQADDMLETLFLNENGAALYQGPGTGRILDHLRYAKNKPVTGGVPLLTVPCVVSDSSAGLMTFLGDFPGIRLCDVSNLGIGEEITYGADAYLTFPWKRRAGDSYDGSASTYGNGYALKKVD